MKKENQFCGPKFSLNDVFFDKNVILSLVFELHSRTDKDRGAQFKNKAFSRSRYSKRLSATQFAFINNHVKNKKNKKKLKKIFFFLFQN